jgi:hypothetical protein
MITMKVKALLSSTLLALTFPLSAFASAYTQSYPSHSSQGLFHHTETIEIAQRQRYVTAQYVSSRLYRSASRILSLARRASNKVNWKSINVETFSADRMRLNIVGKVPVGGILVKDNNIRVGLFLQRDRQGNFRVVDYDFHVWGGHYTGRVRREAAKELRTLPNHYPRFQRVLNSILVEGNQRGGSVRSVTVN